MPQLTYQKPKLQLNEIKSLAQDRYGLKIKRIKPLAGDRSQNFLLESEEGNKYAIKISSAFDHPEELDFENQVMILLRQKLPEYQFPLPLPDVDGQLISNYKKKKSQLFLIRLFPYLPGIYLADLKNIPLSLWKEAGELLAKIDICLKDFYHPGQRRFLPWDLKNVLWSKERLKFVTDPVLKRQLDYCLLQYETKVLPVAHRLRTQVIYGDANEHNFLLTSRKADQARIKGLLDFGDMTESFLVAEVAIALTYALMLKPEEEIAREILSAYHRKNPLQPEELDILFYLILARLTISLTMSAWRRKAEPDNAYMTISENPGRHLLDHLLAENPEKWRKLFYQACGLKMKNHFLPSDKLLGFRKSHLCGALSLAYQNPLHLVQGCGPYLFEADGSRYLDCVNNVCHLGHAHPAVARAVSRQMALLNTNTRYLYDQLALYVEKLLARFPKKFKYVFLVNSGSEANDLALRLARNYTGGSELLVIDGAYHGNLTSLIEISPYKFDGPGGKGAPPFVHKIPTPDPYRGKYQGNTLKTTQKYLEEVAQIIKNLQAENKKLVGLIAESMMGCAGQVIFPPEFLKLAFSLVRAAGGVCIADEVQVGFGRPGKFFWGFESQQADPDIVTLGKPIGNGHPIGAVVTTEEIARAFETGMEYFNTFGGNPVSCAAGLAVLQAVEEENLQENARVVGDYFIKELKILQKSHSLIGHVRGLGLFIGVELVKDPITKEPATEEARQIVEKMKTRGILFSTDGPFRNVLKIKPPIVFNKRNVDQVVEALAEVLKNFA
ncbi:MAG: aminotransferase class III-fold pyridoxal phosphate-dependent enzyme [Candidatus Aminicenantes bacterium]|nr:aminotransferase class III-fold pyridoxal phosphate-dependent enzyme [Candidatus Aminicenantes bacterium]